MTMKMTYGANFKKTSSAVSSVGRPVKGFENKNLPELLAAEPITFIEYLKDSFTDIEAKGGNVTFGYIGDIKVVMAEFPGQEAKFRTLTSFEDDYETYKEKFYGWQNHLRNHL